MTDIEKAIDKNRRRQYDKYLDGVRLFSEGTNGSMSYSAWLEWRQALLRPSSMVMDDWRKW